MKLFSFGKKFNSHAKIFLLFTPPTWPPRTDSIKLISEVLFASIVKGWVLIYYSHLW